MKKSQLIAAAAIVLGMTAAGIGITHAATTNTTGTNPMSNLVTALAQKFNLNTSDVQAVFDEQHAAVEAQHQQQQIDRINQAVTDGKLTQVQADLIIAKQKELQANREANKTKMDSMTETERRTAMKTEMDALKQWATDNNIPDGYLPMGGPGRGHGGPGGFGHGDRGPAAVAPTSDSTTTTNS